MGIEFVMQLITVFLLGSVLTTIVVFYTSLRHYHKALDRLENALRDWSSELDRRENTLEAMIDDVEERQENRKKN